MKIRIAVQGVQSICTEHGMVKAWDICFNCNGSGKYGGDHCDICGGKGFVEHCPGCLA